MPAGAAPVLAVYDLGGSLQGARFIDQPWPSDLRRDRDGPVWDGFPNPRNSPLLGLYLTAIRGVGDGFSPVAPGYLRFTGPIDPSHLPATPTDALAQDAPVQLLDIDPASRERGQRKLVSLSWRKDRGVYLPANTLAFLPTVGFPLRPRTRYALVVTDALRAEGGEAVQQSAVVAAIVGAGPGAGASAARAALEPAITEIERAGVGREHLVHLAVFTTADPTAELARVRDAVPQTVPAPTVDPSSWAALEQTAEYSAYGGVYGPSPNYQAGTLPFSMPLDGGGFTFAGGLPIVVSTFRPRFSLAVPAAAACPMPPSGYPIVLYAHGTGGDYRSYLRDGTASALAKRCLASMGVDQIFHGTRPGAPPDGSESEEALLFFNVQNPIAARTNGRQSAIDEVQRARLVVESRIAVPAGVAIEGYEIRFDASKLLFFGHSQGGINGPLFTAVDPSARGAVFSGSGADLGIALLQKTAPPPSIAGILGSFLFGLSDAETSELDLFHPGIALIQSLMDVVDPVNYARLQATEPLGASVAKSIYMTEGVNPDGTGDHYAPPATIEAHALATGLPLELPAQHPIPQAAWGGPPATAIPDGGLSGNLANGRASGVLAQWAVPPGEDGHFVVFDVPEAQSQAAGFLRNLADDPVGRVPPP